MIIVTLEEIEGVSDSYPMHVFVSPREDADYSREFSDFYYDHENPVQKAFEVLTLDNYPLDQNDKDGFEKALKKNIESVGEDQLD